MYVKKEIPMVRVVHLVTLITKSSQASEYVADLTQVPSNVKLDSVRLIGNVNFPSGVELTFIEEKLR